ncbi:3-dehydrosphinganine reductase TSC10A [Dendrobium catenatum]|uniref:3-dehydrosphinganine reductase n=1 Tax=Dendrobium catenatum TaxID=906689 RepID=A0A2I0VFA2_9ASPA|nr:3-dehydrosphinganine reductase TSC10A [Dendrobium catenatum]PKU62108.1 Tropinone reductase 1 [Dendrobium catenatum]
MSSSLFSPLLLIIIVPVSALLIFLALITRPRPTRIPIKGRHVFITGGSSGIGFAIARLAAAEGARVSILARNRQRLDEARDSIRLATGVEVGVYSVDVRDAEAVARAIEVAGPIDVLICNQGVFTPQELEKQEMDEIKFIVDVNLMGTFHLIKAALPNMKRKTRETGLPSSIAIMSAQAGQVGVYGYTAYSASKFALRGLSEALQHEVIADNIFVSLIFPSDTDTPGFSEELRRRPEISKIIAASSGGMKADDVAKISLNGIKAGRFSIPCNFEGTMLSIVTAGLSPQSSFMAAFLEISFASFMRFVALCFQWNWFSSIEKWHAKNYSKQN